MPVSPILEVKISRLGDFIATLHQGIDSARQRFKGRDGSAAMVLRRTGGAFKARDGLIQKKPTVTRVRKPAPKEIKAEKTEVGEAVQEVIP